LVLPSAPVYYYLAGRQPVTQSIYVLPVNASPRLIAALRERIEARGFDAVAWQDWYGAPPSPALAGLYHDLQSRYHVAGVYALDGQNAGRLTLYQPNSS